MDLQFPQSYELFRLNAPCGSNALTHVTDPSLIDPTFFRASTIDERNRLVNWARGMDAIDADADSNTTEPSRYVADSLHNSPVLVSYYAKASTSERGEAVFIGNNMGVLHAVNAENGDELWSYTPRELISNIKGYADNLSGSHIYGLDGGMTLHTERKTSTNYDYELDKAWLYLTQRRGRNNIIGLDITNAMNRINPFRVMRKVYGGFAGTDFRDLGRTWAKPQMIPVRFGCPNNCSTRNVLLFGGGYNPVYDNTNLSYPVTPQATGHGNAIYMVDPQTGRLIWSTGNGSHHTLNLPMNDSIPTTPVPIDNNADGAVDIMYASDIAGHIWRIDLNKKPAAARDLAIGGGKIASLNASGQALRFFNRPDVVISGLTEGTANFNINLGSGMRSSPLFNEPHNNRVFVLKDPWVFNNPVGDQINSATGLPYPRYTYVRNGDNSRSAITPNVMWEFGTQATATSRHFGFYKDLTQTGEKYWNQL